MKAEVLLLAAFGALTLPASAARIGLARTQLFSGYDGKWCKVQPSVASDGEGTAFLTYQMLDLGGSDVFSGQYLSKSTDGGETWSQPVKISESADVHERGLRVARYVNVYYLARSRRWTAMGSATMYGADARPYQKYAEGRPYCYPVQADVDAESGRIANYRPMPFPFEYELAMRFGQVVECENGEVLMPFYYRPVGAGRKGRAVVVRYRAGKDGWEIVRAGTPVVEDSLARGVGEPSVVKFRGRHYMTLRSDEYGMYAESEDGLNYSKPVKWVWADGQPIGNANTQQHWVPVGDRLYLAYTRVTPTNGHVFRNRAPIFMSEFDPARRCLLRETEREVVPERGARLGNFVVAPGRTGESWLVTAEWMQPKGCESHGSDNSLWLVKIGAAIRPSIVRDGRSDWTIVHGSAERDRLAATELQEIFEKATGISLELRVKSEECRTSRCFLVGAEFAGKELADEQTWVTAKDGNVVLAGGGVAGTCYAVYDFCEKYFGYRLYGTYPGAEIVKKVTDLAWDGKDISTKPAFAGYRISHNVPKARNEAEARFFRRNRNNAGDRPVTDRILGAQHGFFLWVPSAAKGYGSTWLDRMIGAKWEPMFERHPEYFSLDRQGRRTNRGQLCFANKDVRKLLISRFREFAAKKGPGVYMVGSNDSHNERYCWCDGCAKMMAKYRTNGGPLWDFILELCGAVKDMKGVYVASLVYKGPEQTELAPTGVVFPENFVADLGFLNADRPPSRMRDIKLEDGRVYNRLQSIRDWKAVARHVAWWYYGGGMPIQTYRRMQVEMRELLSAGVDSIGSCGTGGSFEFQDVGDYMFFRLMRDPEMDADAAVMDIFRHKYGAAAQLVFDYLKELETYAIDNWGNPNFSFGTEDKYEKIPLEGADIERWQGYFEKALELVRDDPQSLANVKIARTGLDCWTIVWASRVRKDAPGFKLDTNAILARAFAACDAAEKRGIVTAKCDFARRSLESMKYYAMLKTDALPAELAKEDPAKVWLYLPEEPKHDYAAKSHALVKDPNAAAGVAIPVRNQDFAKSINVQLFDAAGKEWLKVHPIDAKDVSGTEYRMVEFGVSRIPRTGMLVFGNAWGSAADIRTLDRFYDPSYHEKLFQFYASVRREGNDLLIDRVYLVDRGMPK